jgi:hypothetical protein
MMQRYGLVFLVLMLSWGLIAADDGEKQKTKRRANVQIALLLDTSGSMSGLIDQAKSRLWNVVNEMSQARMLGLTPRLEVALYEYGKSTLPSSEGYIRQILPLSTDLDAVSEALFALNTNGGDEYCGLVIGRALDELRWHNKSSDFKAIFIAGNEPFDQGPADFRAACARAIASGVVVNTIFCGPESEGINTHWKEGADLADGRFMVINHNQEIAHITAPQDARILELGRALNDTYLGYGQKGRQAKERQVRQDANAKKVSEETLVARTMAKASPVYEAESWDIVSAVEGGKVEVDAIDEEALPEPMKDMDDREKKTYIKEQAEKRAQLQQEIAKLQKEREDWLREQRANQPGDTLDAAMSAAVREQMKRKQFTFPKKD